MGERAEMVGAITFHTYHSARTPEHLKRAMDFNRAAVRDFDGEWFDDEEIVRFPRELDHWDSRGACTILIEFIYRLQYQSEIETELKRLLSVFHFHTAHFLDHSYNRSMVGGSTNRIHIARNEDFSWDQIRAAGAAVSFETSEVDEP